MGISSARSFFAIEEACGIISGMRTAKDFPYSYPEYLSPVLRILGDGLEHSTGYIRERILAEFPLTLEQLALKRAGYHTTVFVNKVAFAFNRLVFHKAI